MPHINYCSTVLFMFNEQQLDGLQKVQNRFMRLILRAPWETHIKDMLNILEWLSVEQQVHYNTLKFINRMVEGKCPEYMSRKIVKRKTIHTQNTRRRSHLVVPNFTLAIMQSCLFYKGIKSYNKFNEECKPKTENEFKRNCLEFVRKYKITQI